MALWVYAMSSPTITKLEACQVLFRGQSNVKLMANQLEITLEEMQRLFREYCAANPIDEDVWRGDIEMGWPWA